ncbi:hypothetical protein CKN86_06190 [Carnobacterium divergens]|uniref:hypothetical protein n=1 Tax=Carnobacterium divergens TaxID=2748 RepID=UPI000D3F4D82|nr:hypothetical protein [Carnobacterium divergens]MCO6017041.1 hypothetical protein [Carnobacterium divergens]MPQ22481.1 hypothetical protein [Carnobacterium divergens]TFI62427.1 hypothetical protein CKN62_06225 [Carnobacterium divergens]TFI89629.1 hypothetical protein CKN84_06225 [Carnobacterium divergens]TFJ04684.1 hypothetical protein CKN86_06190 [Carnobacterium divergens]
MSDNYTDKQRMEIAEQEYNSYKESDPVKIGKEKNKIGYVSQVNDKSTGEQSFVITDNYVSPTSSLSERNQVKEVTVIYRDSSFELSSDAAKDWLLNDIPTGIQVANGGGAVTCPYL